MASESSKGIEWRSLLQLAQKSPAAALALKHLAAVVIQSNYRGAVVRRKYKACIATRRAIDRAVPQITLSLLEECYLGMCTAIVLEIMEKSTSRQAAEQALQEEMMSVFRDVASQVVYDEVRRFVVPKAIREITDTLIRKERKPTRINPLVAVVDDLLGEASGELVPRAVIQAIRDVTDEYLLHAKAEWMLQQIVQELVDADVREWVTEEVAAFAQIKEEWVSEEIVSAVAADVATDAHAELTVSGLPISAIRQWLIYTSHYSQCTALAARRPERIAAEEGCDWCVATRARWCFRLLFIWRAEQVDVCSVVRRPSQSRHVVQACWCTPGRAAHGQLLSHRRAKRTA